MHEDAERKISKVSDLTITHGFVLTRQGHVKFLPLQRVPQMLFVLCVAFAQISISYIAMVYWFCFVHVNIIYPCSENKDLSLYSITRTKLMLYIQ